MSRRTKNLLWLLASAVITVVFLLPIFSKSYLDLLINFIDLHPFTAPLVILIFRFIGVVAAPLPGSPVAFASLAVLSWWQAWLFNLAGIMIGAVTAFFIARKYREPIVNKFAPMRQVHEWQNRIPKKRQFWTIALFRFTSIVAFDFVSYASGLTKMSFRVFLATSLMAEVPWSFTLYYLGGTAVRYSIYLFILGGLIFIGLAAFLNLQTKTIGYQK